MKKENQKKVSSKKTWILFGLLLMTVVASKQAFAVCLPKAPAKYAPYYPFQIKNTNGTIFNGLILPSLSSNTLEIRDANKVLYAKVPINSVLGTSGSGTCSTSAYSLVSFKTKVLGDDGKTAVLIERFVGNELYKITVTWKGIKYTRSN